MKKLIIAATLLVSCSAAAKVTCVGEVCMVDPFNYGIPIPHVSSSHSSYEAQRAVIQMQGAISKATQASQLLKLYSIPDVYKRPVDNMFKGFHQ